MAAATSGQKKTAEFSSFSAALAKSVAPIYISGKPTQTEVVALTPPPSQDKNAERNSLFSFLFFSFSPKKLWNQTSSLKREEKKAFNGKRTDEGAEKRKKKKPERRGKNITGGQLSGLFLEDCFSILQWGWREQGGSVSQLAGGGGGWRGRRRGVEKEKGAEVNECMGHLNLKTVQYSEYSGALSSLKGPVSRRTERKMEGKGVGGREGGGM